MPELTASRPKKPSMSIQKKIGLGILAFLILGLIVFVAYIHILTSSYKPPPPQTYGATTLAVSMTAQKLFAYNLGQSVLPYVLFHYDEHNVSNLNLTLNFYNTGPPENIYVLNWSNQCFSACTSIPTVISALTSNLVTYGVFNSSSKVKIVTKQNLTALPNDSVLILLNGLLPDFMLNSSSGGTELDQLMDKGDAVLYIGGDFSRLISSGSVVIPNNVSSSALAFGVASYHGDFNTSGYYFNQPLFELASQPAVAEGPLSYETLGDNGTLVVFPNYLSSWPDPNEAGHDLAKAIYDLFWVTSYASGNLSISPANPHNSIGNIGLPLTSFTLTSKGKDDVQSIVSSLDSAYARATIIGTSPTGNISYNLLYFKPEMFLNGVIQLPTNITPGEDFNTTATVFVNSTQTIEPHFDIFNQNLSLVASLPPFFTKSVSPPSYSFVQEISLQLPSGSYIAQLDGFSNQNYGSAYFSIPPISVTIPTYNFNTSMFTIALSADGVPLQNINATVYLDNQFEETIPVQNGEVVYGLSKDEALPQGKLLNFTVNILGTNFTYQLLHVNPQLTLNRQYIEFILTLLIVIVEITIIKAPARDDFYVDVSSMPRPTLQNVNVRYSEFLGVFDKLNTYYHWHYMPLSKSEFRIAVSNNIHIASMPVMLTYKNIDLILDQLVVRGHLVTVDDLYAPASWIAQSGHDIGYLATFKKLRVYLVSHGHMFTELDKSDAADIVTTLHNEKAYLVIYSPTSKFKKIPVYTTSKTYLAFLNSDALDAFKRKIYGSTSREAEELKLYISVGSVVLIDADGPEGILT